MRKPKLDEAKMIRCPTCRFEYLHHDRIVTHSRREDSDADVQVINVPDEDRTSSAQPLASIPIPENPSDCRSGVVISGWCEGCENRWNLALAQHEGHTLIWMVPSESHS